MGCSLALMSLHKHIILGAIYAGSSPVSVHSNTASIFLRLQETSHSHAFGEVLRRTSQTWMCWWLHQLIIGRDLSRQKVWTTGRVSQEPLECNKLYCFELNNMLMTVHICSYTCVQMTPLQFNTNPQHQIGHSRNACSGVCTDLYSLDVEPPFQHPSQVRSKLHLRSTRASELKGKLF